MRVRRCAGPHISNRDAGRLPAGRVSPSVKTAAFVALFAVRLLGQTVESEMSADRPGFRNSTHLVGPGVVQLESGVSFSRERTFTLQPEIRIGTLEWLEFRLFTESVVLRSPAGSERKGTSDLTPGIKFPLFNRILGTRVVAIVKTTVPSGHASQTSGGYEPGAELIWEHQLTDDFSFAGTWNLTRLKQERFVWQKAASLAANRSIGPKLKTFAEVYVVSPVNLGTGNQWNFDAGLMRPVKGYVMLDAAAGHSFHGPRDWFVTVGVSLRSRIPSTEAPRNLSATPLQ